MDDFERELKEDFLDESVQLLGDSEQAFLELENNKDDADLLDQIFRLAHNLKGTSRAVGFGEVAEFTHEMENLILKLKTGDLEATDFVVTVLLECNDHITHMINTLKDDMDATFDNVAIVTKIKQALGEGGSVESTVDVSPAEEEKSVEPVEEQTVAPVVTTSSEEISEVVDDGTMNEISPAALEALRELGDCDSEILKELEENTKDNKLEFKKGDEKIEIPPVQSGAEGSSPASPVKKAPLKKKGGEDESIRVSLSKVELLNNFVGELVILQTVLDQRRAEVIQDELANKSISQLAKLSKEIQEISMSLRMIPVKQTLQKMTRIVRDTSKTLDKKVNLTLSGEETEIDKTVLEFLADPLVHIVRNAVDHGLEDTEKRVALGKSEVGEIRIAAFYEGNNMVIEVKDDGGGIDAEIIRKKALEKGLINSNESIADEDMIQYIFHPGFSTKEQVTEVSGRGVGMDVVKTNIEQLGGSVDVRTQLGKGSTFKVVLPLTMAIIEGMVVRLGAEKYIIPLGQVHESLRPTESMIHQVTGMGECLNLRGEVLPLFNVGRELNRKTDEKNSKDKIAIIVHTSTFNFSVIVDDILHQQQVVIKKLGDEIRNAKGFMGSSILADGKPAFILDLIELFEKKMKKHKGPIADRGLQQVA